MKKTKTIYWIITGLFAAFMTFSSIPDVLMLPEAKAFITQLGYPAYFVPFIGVLKLAGVVAILIPGFPGIKEWAYAGFFFNLTGATYSQIANNGFMPQMLFMLLPLGFMALSYIYYHKLLKAV